MRFWPLFTGLFILLGASLVTGKTAPDDSLERALDAVAQVMEAPPESTVTRVDPGLDWRKLLLAAAEWFPRSTPQREVWIRETMVCGDSLILPYHFRLPETYDPHHPNPLLIYLHGGVSRSEAPDSGPDTDFPEGYLTEWATDRGMVVLVPSGKKGAVWWDSTGVAYLQRVLRTLKGRLNIDDDRVYLTGFSDGASGTYFQALFHPSAYAALVPQCGHPGVAEWGEPPRQGYFPNLANRPLYIINNDEDRLYPGARMQQFVELMREAGARIIFRRFPRWGHRPDFWEVEKENVGRFLDYHPREVKSRLVLEGAEPVRCDWLQLDSLAGMPLPAAYRDYNTTYESSRLLVGFIPDDSFAGAGFRVKELSKGEYPAGRMGLRAGDVITALDQEPVENDADFRRAMLSHHAGEEFSLTVLRNGEKIVLRDHFNEPRLSWLLRREKPALRVEAARTANRLNLTANRLGVVTIYLDPRLVDCRQPVEILLNGRRIFRKKVDPDPLFMLKWLHRTRDRRTLYLNAVTLHFQELWK